MVVSMRIEMTTEGGFAPIPSLSAPIVLDVAKMPPDQGAEAQRLADAALDESRRSPSGRSRMPDVQQHSIVIHREDGKHEIKADDITAGPAINALMQFIRRQGRR